MTLGSISGHLRFKYSVRSVAFALWAAIVTLDLLVCVGVVLALDNSRENYEARAAEFASNAVSALDQSISVYVRQIDLASLTVVDYLEDQLKAGPKISEIAASRFLSRQNNHLRGDFGIRVSNADGVVTLGRDVSIGEKASWGDRDFFSILAGNPDYGLLITDPIMGRVTKTWQIAFVRRYNAADGKFAGVVSITISLKALEKLLAGQNLGPHGMALLRDSHRHMVVRYPASDSVEGQIGATSYSTELGKIMDSGLRSVSYHPLRSPDGVDRVNAYLRLTAAPYYLIAGRASEDYLEPWHLEVHIGELAALTYISVTALLGWLLHKSLRISWQEARQTQTILRGASDQIHILNRSGSILEASQSFCEALGYQAEEIIGTHIQSIDAALSPENVNQVIDAVLRQGGSLHFETMHRRKDGSLIPVEVSARQLNLDGEELIFASARNIEERLRAAKELVESEGRFRQLIEKNQSVMLEINPQTGQILAANASAAIFYGYTAEQLQHMLISEINTATPEVVSLEMLSAAREERGYFNFRHRLASGEIRDVEVYSTPIEIQGQKQLFSIVHDISYRVQAERRVRQLLDEQRAILNSDIVGICKLRDRKMVWVNAAYARMFGYLESELIGQSTEFFHLDIEASQAFEQASSAAISSGQTFRTQCQFRRKDESVGWFDITGTMIEAGGKETVWALADISSIKAAEVAQRLAASVFANSYEGIVITDADNRIVDVNPAYHRITGYPREEVIGKNPNLVTSGRQTKDFYQRMWDTLQAHDVWQGEVWNRHKDGNLYAEMLSISVVRDERGAVQNHIGVFSDISNLKQHEQELDKIAHFDPLTGLPNRRYFHDQMQHELGVAARTGSNVALILIDLDHFKEVNDTLGHDAGDLLLGESAHRLQKCVRESDSVSRIGGDEFVVVMPGLKGLGAVTRVAQSIVETMQIGFSLSGQETFISASVGVAIYPEDASDATDLFKHADQAMYQAKSLGRNRFEYFKSSMQTAARARLSIARDLRHALAEHQFELHYQPIVDLNNGEVVKCEALIRWQHPQRGLLGPAEFIAIAEESGLIGQIGDWVFYQAIRDIAELNALAAECPGAKPIAVGVNTSPKQFHYGLDLNGWLGHLKETGLAPEKVVIEITEGLLLEQRPEVSRQLLAFRDAGIQVAIDDFGIGYSALSYLTRLDIDYLKIDQSFIRVIETNHDDFAIVQAIVSMAHKLQIKTIAEGIETEAQRDMLKNIGCDFGQGYFFERPMPLAKLRALLLKETSPA